MKKKIFDKIKMASYLILLRWCAFTLWLMTPIIRYRARKEKEKYWREKIMPLLLKEKSGSE